MSFPRLLLHEIMPMLRLAGTCSLLKDSLIQRKKLTVREIRSSNDAGMHCSQKLVYSHYLLPILTIDNYSMLKNCNKIGNRRDGIR